MDLWLSVCFLEQATQYDVEFCLLSTSRWDLHLAFRVLRFPNCEVSSPDGGSWQEVQSTKCSPSLGNPHEWQELEIEGYGTPPIATLRYLLNSKFETKMPVLRGLRPSRQMSRARSREKTNFNEGIRKIGGCIRPPTAPQLQRRQN
jgi:hypothetical protein